MGVNVREKRKKLYLDIYLGGKRTWEALGLTLTHDREQNKEIYRLAEVCRSKRETQLLAGAWDIQDPVRSKTKLVTFLEEYSKTYKTPANVLSVVGHVKKFSNGAAIQICQVTPNWVDQFQQHLLNKAGLSHTSALSYSKVIRAALKKAVGAGLILRNPADAVAHIHEEDIELEFLNFDEVQKLADVRYEDDHFAEEVRRAFLFACNTGLRVSDLETITWRRIETNPMQIIKKQEKTRDPAYIPLNKAAQKLLGNSEHKPDDTLFDLPAKKRQNTYKLLNRWAEDAKITKRIGWHTARRTFATMELENGVDIYIVAKLLGHRTITQVAKYAKATDKLRREAVNALPELAL
ncbi:MAG: site-specific integrase [Spirochaetaceae bacterium]|jgi:integrase|nr:site-specific integrase [Spirochaetaceae bacterium]